MPRTTDALLATIHLALLLATSAAPAIEAPAVPPTKQRLLILTDIGGDPDDQQALVRLMTYTCDFDIEGFIASASGTPGELKEAVTRPDLIRKTIQAYDQVRPNLLLHRPDYPPAGALVARIKSGNPHRGRDQIGEGHDTEGSRWIIERGDTDDPRPLNITIWGGQTDLAQALWRVRKDRRPDQLKRFMAQLCVYDIDDQDKIQPWIFENFPELFYILAKAPPKADKRTGGYRGMYLGGDESLTSWDWIDAHVRTGHGPLGSLYPTKTYTAPNPNGCLKEGDSPSWLYFLPTGLNDSNQPEWGSWGGRYLKSGNGSLYTDATDTVGNTTDARAAVWRWRPDFQADFQARMDWCVKPFAGANHPPVAVVNADATDTVVPVHAAPGATLSFSSAGSSDPDGNAVSFRWFVYPEAGTFRGQVVLSGSDAPVASLTLPTESAGKTIHVVLAVTDAGKPSLTRYRRVIVKAALCE